MDAWLATAENQQRNVASAHGPPASPLPFGDVQGLFAHMEPSSSTAGHNSGSGVVITLTTGNHTLCPKIHTYGWILDNTSTRPMRRSQIRPLRRQVASHEGVRRRASDKLIPTMPYSSDNTTHVSSSNTEAHRKAELRHGADSEEPDVSAQWKLRRIGGQARHSLRQEHDLESNGLSFSHSFPSLFPVLFFYCPFPFPLPLSLSLSLYLFQLD